MGPGSGGSGGRVTLANGLTMPLVGYGTWRLGGPTLLAALAEALAAGYRLIDTAQVYRNEELVGQALATWRSSARASSSSPRLGSTRSEEEEEEEEHVFVTTKVSPRAMGAERTRASVLASLTALQVPVLDLVLLHWPGTAKIPLSDHTRQRALRLESWRELQDLYAAGLVRAIGVSNFTIAHLRELAAGGGVQPMVNQVEFHPLLYDAECRALLAHCRQHGIHVQAYASLGEGALATGEPTLLPELPKLLSAHYPGHTCAQVLLRWALQHGCSVLPKSTKPDRIRSNLQLDDFALHPKDMAVLDGLLGHGEQGAARRHRFCWDPNTVS